VREDPRRKGLLFCGSELTVHVSFDDGDHWQPLRHNLPATSIRDLIIKDDDLVIATHGRGFWILDDISPLRQYEPPALAADAHLFRPQPALRMRWNTSNDTPLPPDEPAMPNPPDGAIIDYYLRADASGPVSLDIIDGDKKLIRSYSSNEKLEPPRDDGNVPAYWIRPQQIPSTKAGLHRFVWDLHYPPLQVEHGYPIAAIAHDTPREPRGPWVLSGTYQVRLTVGDKSYTEALQVVMDPRIATPLEGLRQQRDLSLRAGAAAERATEALTRVRARKGANAESEKKLQSIIGTLTHLFSILQSADVTPRAKTVESLEETLQKLEAMVQQSLAM
jgi:hypothetical protein